MARGSEVWRPEVEESAVLTTRRLPSLLAHGRSVPPGIRQRGGPYWVCDALSPTKGLALSETWVRRWLPAVANLDGGS